MNKGMILDLDLNEGSGDSLATSTVVPSVGLDLDPDSRYSGSRSRSVYKM